MSKKSTSRTRNDGDADYGSGRSSSSEESKCVLYPNLSLKEEGTGPSGDYSSTHKILTSNLDESHRNHEVQTENTPRSKYSSQSTLDDDLYGNADKFNNSLEFLTNELYDLKITSRNNSSDLDKYSNIQMEHGYLSAGETLLNLSSPPENNTNEHFINFSPHSIDLTKPIRTIYESYDTDNTTSSGSYIIPKKKHCLREKTPRLPPITSKIILSPSPENLNLSLLRQKSSTENLPSPFKTLVPKPGNIELDTVKDLFRTACTSPGSSINYTVPIKRICTRERTPRIVNPPSVIKPINIKPKSSKKLFANEIYASPKEQAYLHLKHLSEGESISPPHTINASSWSATERSKSESIEHSENFELGLKLPSSIIGDTSSNKSTPLEPNIAIKDTKTFQQFRGSRFGVIPEISRSRRSSTNTICSSGDQSRNEENSSLIIKLYQKYYEDTSDISSNANSTPPYVVSSPASISSSCPSPSTEKAISEKNLEPKPLSNPVSSTNCTKPETFNPLFNSSLDIPKRLPYPNIFPAISQITSIPRRLIFETCASDIILEEESEITLQESYKNKTEGLFPVSPTKGGSGRGDCPSRKMTSPRNFPSNVNKRKIQSTDISFYSVSSEVTADDLELKKDSFRTSDSSSEGSVDVEEKCSNCCCCNFFFSRRKPQFFT